MNLFPWNVYKISYSRSVVSMSGIMKSLLFPDKMQVRGFFLYKAVGGLMNWESHHFRIPFITVCPIFRLMIGRSANCIALGRTACLHCINHFELKSILISRPCRRSIVNFTLPVLRMRVQLSWLCISPCDRYYSCHSGISTPSYKQLSEWTKTVHALDRAATAIGTTE
jgi:hypothetical protein